MSVKQQIQATDGTFFITITCFNWLPLFEISTIYNAIYKWFNVLKNKGHFINGYVIMPNHLHALIGFSNTGKNINTIIGNGKRFIAYNIIQQLKESNNEIILARLSDAVKPSDRKRDKLHEVFENSFDAKEYFTKKFLLQKLDYIPARQAIQAGIGILVGENGNLLIAAKTIFIVLRVITTKEPREFNFLTAETKNIRPIKLLKFKLRTLAERNPLAETAGDS